MRKLVEFRPAALAPADGELHAAPLYVNGVVRVGTHIQGHHHVAAVLELYLDALFRGEGQLFTTAVGPKDDLPIPDLAVLRVFTDQGIELEAAGIGQDRAAVPGEAVQPAKGLHKLGPGLGQQVVAVHLTAVQACRVHIFKRSGSNRAIGGVREKSRQGKAAGRGFKMAHVLPPLMMQTDQDLHLHS